MATTAEQTAPTEGEVNTSTEAGHGEGSFPPFDSSTFPSQILWLAISFGLLYLLMSRVVIPRIGGILQNRADRIHGDLAEANRLKGESDAAAAAYEQALAQARNNAADVGQKAREAAKSEADAKRGAAESALSARLADAEKTIAASKARAMTQVGSIAADTAKAIVAALVGSAVSQADIEKAVKAELGN